MSYHIRSWVSHRDRFRRPVSVIAYTTAGMLFYGVIRLWTGSIVYAVLTHTAVNFIFLTGFGCIVSGIG